MSEKFKRSWWGWARSSEGFAVRFLGKTNLQYRDDRGLLHINAEAMSSPWNNIVVYSESIPDTEALPRAEVIERLERAFRYRGWNLLLDDGQGDPRDSSPASE